MRTTFFVWNILRKNTARHLRQTERKQRRPRRDGYILFPVDRKGHRRRIDRRAALEVPKRFAGSGFERDEVPLRVARKDESSCCGKHSRPGRRRMLPFPFHFSSVRIDGAQSAAERRGIVVRKIRAAIVSVSRFVWLRRGAEDVTLFPRRYIEELRLRIVSRRHPVRRAGRPRAHAIPFQRRRGVLSRNGSSARILRVAPSHFCERVRELELSIGAINQIKKSVPVR